MAPFEFYPMRARVLGTKFNPGKVTGQHFELDHRVRELRSEPIDLGSLTVDLVNPH